MTAREHVTDAIVVGAGFAGLYQLIRLRDLGLDTVVLERAPQVGGTWYWNRYPGARCDITSLDYSYSFDAELQQEWEWSEKFATQPEILRYAEHVADRFDLNRDIRFGRAVTAARWEEQTQTWTVTVMPADRWGAPQDHSAGELYRAKYLILAVGNLSAAHLPDIAGIADFAGRSFHSAQWPEDGVDFTGRRVGIIGTGSTGIQIIPLVAEQAGHLTVFHRTPNFSLPAGNRPLHPEEVRERKADYPAYRERARHSFTGVPVPVPTRSVFEVTAQERERVFEEAWESGVYGALLASFTDLSTDADANELAAEFIRRKVRSLVEDPELAAVLEPRGNYFGTKRTCLDTGYYQTFNRPDTTLVDLRQEPLVRITRTGVATEGRHVELDDLIFATGFDAMTGSLLAIDPVGRGGLALSEAWREGPYTFLGLAAHDFPNMFFITGPGSPSVLSNMIVSIEQHVDWVTGFIERAERDGAPAMHPTEQAQREWMQTVHDEAAKTLYLHGNSWYLGANVPGKPRVFMPYVGGVGQYRDIAEREEADGYPNWERVA
ncbi:NAD(P)/FAD-dependent oxidoreductase [Microbacterium soli]|uniref:Cyclohexanone monooxygenase n=1 Tax=Microbacterium soli TaxID=446075 RepID=A0ABP7N3X5_9MICO